MEALDLRSALEAFGRLTELHAEAARAGAARVTRQGLAAMRAADADQRAALAAGDVDAAIAADDRFHGVLVAAAGDAGTTAELEALLPRIRRFDRVVFAGKSFTETTSGSHDEIIAAVEAKDAERAAALVERSFEAAGEQLRERLGR